MSEHRVKFSVQDCGWFVTYDAVDSDDAINSLKMELQEEFDIDPSQVEIHEVRVERQEEGA